MQKIIFKHIHFLPSYQNNDCGVLIINFLNYIQYRIKEVIDFRRIFINRPRINDKANSLKPLDFFHRFRVPTGKKSSETSKKVLIAS